MMVVLAARVERCVTNHALKTTIKVLLNGQLGAAGAAENGPVAPLTLRPNLDRMVGKSRVAIFARVKRAATPHLDGHDVGWAVIVFAPSLHIEIQAPHFAPLRVHIPNCDSARRQRTFVETDGKVLTTFAIFDVPPFFARVMSYAGRMESSRENFATGFRYLASAAQFGR
jgi:hypothetical protein